MTFAEQFLLEAKQLIDQLVPADIERVAQLLASTREGGGRLFILGIGGNAANAAHAVNDFRKIAGMEAYSPTDNISELSARVNDEGFDSFFETWLKGSRLKPEDALLVLSVGGGSTTSNVSTSLVRALDFAQDTGAHIAGIVGRDGGHTARVANVCVVIPTVNPCHVTPLVEAFQAVVWHLIVSHPALKRMETKWESVEAGV
jgi:D-sedoheptulose 7-phosphate isomerase